MFRIMQYPNQQAQVQHAADKLPKRQGGTTKMSPATHPQLVARSRLCCIPVVAAHRDIGAAALQQGVQHAAGRLDGGALVPLLLCQAPVGRGCE